ncbi:death-associated -like 1 [Pelobates cultripes]|uniref:Death-associated -like 1 n=1 Tax=Pelobates cultripes TaxID=61616 RepID=A0AAD1WGQ4_PELCU|nr:death-associated -like 1 [Pelobates cultripes]
MEVMYKATYPCDKLSRPPAVKAGGMRVTKKQASDSGAPEKHLKKPVVERPSSLVNMTNIQAMNLLTGALDKVCLLQMANFSQTLNLSYSSFHYLPLYLME